MNLETKITIYNFTPSGFYVDPFSSVMTDGPHNKVFLFIWDWLNSIFLYLWIIKVEVARACVYMNHR